MRGVGELAFGREGVVLEPGQQAGGGRADDVGLRVMHVHVHEARRQDAARQVGGVGAGMALRHIGMAAGVEHALAAGAVGGDDQQAVLVEDRQAGGVES
ncbi:hypothetical protein D9M69_623120 [compost metagenome]